MHTHTQPTWSLGPSGCSSYKPCSMDATRCDWWTNNSPHPRLFRLTEEYHWPKNKLHKTYFHHLPNLDRLFLMPSVATAHQQMVVRQLLHHEHMYINLMNGAHNTKNIHATLLEPFTLPSIFLSIEINSKIFRVKVNNRRILLGYSMWGWCTMRKALTGSTIRFLQLGGRKLPLAAGNTAISCSNGLNWTKEAYNI